MSSTPCRFAALAVVFLSNAVSQAVDHRLAPLSPPATPLIANDPFFQTWSPRGDLNDNPTVAGSNGREQQMSAMLHSEGSTCQLMGPSSNGATKAIQKSVIVYPTRTIYVMVCGSTDITMTFFTASLPSNLTVMARPVSYLTVTSSALAGKLYVDISAQAACGANPQQPHNIEAVASGLGSGAVTTFGWLGNAATQKDPIPCPEGSGPNQCRSGDNINWGRLFLAAPTNTPVHVLLQSKSRSRFASDGTLAPSSTTPMQCGQQVTDQPVLATVLDLTSTTAATVIFAYDEAVAIRWWGENFPGFWTRETSTMPGMLDIALREAQQVQSACESFDDREVDKYFNVGGAKFASILALAYRQTYASTKLAWNTEQHTHW